MDSVKPIRNFFGLGQLKPAGMLNISICEMAEDGEKKYLERATTESMKELNGGQRAMDAG
jgi:hypothetical protein